VDNPVERPRNPWPAIVLVVGAAVILWFGYQKLRTPSRCHDLYLSNASATLRADAPSLRPSDAAWYNEHCWNGQPR
jgi:hypothetical protein